MRGVKIGDRNKVRGLLGQQLGLTFETGETTVDTNLWWRDTFASSLRWTKRKISVTLEEVTFYAIFDNDEDAAEFRLRYL